MPTAVLLPWDDEVNINGSSNKKRRMTTTTNASEANARAEVVDGATRPMERNNATIDTDANSSKKFSLMKDIGVRDMVAGGHDVYESSGRKIADAERNRNRDGEASTVPSKENSFFARLDELKAYKVKKYGHLKVSKKKDLPVQTLSSEEQRKASHVISHNLISTMPTPVLRPWDDENMTGSNNKKRRVRTIALTNETAGADGSIRLEERTNAMDAATKHSLPKSIGATEVAIVSISKPTEMDTIENEDHNVTPSCNSTQNDFQPHRQNHGGEGLQPVEQSHDELDIVQQMNNLEQNERLKPSYPNAVILKQKNDKGFFSRVDKLGAYKEKHGHLNVREKENQSLYNFCKSLRSTRRAILTGEGRKNYLLDDGRIAALDAIGFEWESGLEVSSTAASNDDIFFTWVDKLMAYKEEHGHLNVRKSENEGLYNFCCSMRGSRRAIVTGKGRKNYSLDGDRIAALDAIGFNWEAGASYNVGFTRNDDTFFARIDELKAYKDRHGHLNMSRKEDQRLYSLCSHLRRSRRAILTGEVLQGKRYYRLDDGRIAALDAIGFEWESAGASSTAAINDVSFFARVDKLRAYKEEHGHFNVRKKENEGLYDFCNKLRLQSRSKGFINFRLDENRVAALDAIGFNWIKSAGASSTPASKKDDMCHSHDRFDRKLGAGPSSTMASKDDGAKEKMDSKENSFFARLDELKAYKNKHGRYVQKRH